MVIMMIEEQELKIKAIDTGFTNVKVLLLRPPQTFYYGDWPKGPRLSLPLGLLSIASFLRREGVPNVTIYDAFVEGDAIDKYLIQKNKNKKIAEIWTDFDESQRPEGENKEVKFGASFTDIENYLRIQKPNIVGITNSFRENEQETIRSIEIIRRVLPDAVIVVGGANANAEPDKFLMNSNSSHYVALGDGEKPLLGIINILLGNADRHDVPGLVFLENGKVSRSAQQEAVYDLDEYGKHDYSLLKMERYFRYEKNGVMARSKFQYGGSDRVVSLATTRGCPYKCTFCSIHIHAGRKLRRYSEKYIVDEIEDLVNNFNVKHIHFEDDNLTLDKTRFIRVFNSIRDKGIRFTWDTPNGIFANTLDDQMAKTMLSSGVTYLIFGVESGDQRVLDEVVKKQPLTIEKVENAFKIAKKHKIDSHAFYIIGFPEEKLYEIRRTLYFAVKHLLIHGIVPHLAIARADPGTELYNEAIAKDVLVSDYVNSDKIGVHADMFARHRIKTEEFSPEKLENYSLLFHRAAIVIIMLRVIVRMIWSPIIYARAIKSHFNKNPQLKISNLKLWVISLFFAQFFYLNAIERYYRIKD